MSAVFENWYAVPNTQRKTTAAAGLIIWLQPDLININLFCPWITLTKSESNYSDTLNFEFFLLPPVSAVQVMFPVKYICLSMNSSYWTNSNGQH